MVFFVDYPQSISLTDSGLDAEDDRRVELYRGSSEIEHRFDQNRSISTIAGGHSIHVRSGDDGSYYVNYIQHNLKYIALINPEVMSSEIAGNSTKLWLDLISKNVSTSVFDHHVTINANVVQYQRRLQGQSTGSGWVTLSQAGKICAEPSITAADGDSVYVVWIQRDTVGGNPYVVAQKVPEKYQPVIDSTAALFTVFSHT